jgi:hypothetical protein
MQNRAGNAAQNLAKLIEDASKRVNEGQQLSPAERTIVVGALENWQALQTSPAAQPILTSANPIPHTRDNKKRDVGTSAGPVTAVPQPAPPQALQQWEQPLDQQAVEPYGQQLGQPLGHQEANQLQRPQLQAAVDIDSADIDFPTLYKDWDIHPSAEFPPDRALNLAPSQQLPSRPPTPLWDSPLGTPPPAGTEHGDARSPGSLDGRPESPSQVS